MCCAKVVATTSANFDQDAPGGNRTRRGDNFGTAQQSITPRKAAKLREVGLTYIQSIEWKGPWRIDVVAIQMDGRGHLLEINHIRSAVTG